MQTISRTSGLRMASIISRWKDSVAHCPGRALVPLGRIRLRSAHSLTFSVGGGASSCRARRPRALRIRASGSGVVSGSIGKLIGQSGQGLAYCFVEPRFYDRAILAFEMRREPRGQREQSLAQHGEDRAHFLLIDARRDQLAAPRAEFQLLAVRLRLDQPLALL